MKLAGMIRCKNGERWIEESVRSLLQVCQTVTVLDDNSTDRTAEIIWAIPGAHVIPSPFSNLNEARDKTFLLEEIRRTEAPDWVLCIDADEVLLDPEAVLINAKSGASLVYSLHVLMLWDRPDQIRVDGVYGNCWRASMFRADIGNGQWVQENPDGPNIHCNSVPADLAAHSTRSNPEVRLKHYGPMLREDRIRKYEYYLSIDPNPHREDHYRHSVQGDLPQFPADAKYRHAGPLELKPFAC